MAGEFSVTAASGGGSAAFVGPPSSSINTKLKLPADTGAAGKVLKIKSANHSSTNAELEWAADAGGKVLQIVQASHSSAVTDTSGSYTDTGLTASITTSSSHAGVLVFANLAMGATANNGGDAYAGFNLVRGSTQVREGMCGGWQYNLSGHTHVMYWQPAMNYYDTGTSASTSYTYKCQFKKLSDAVNAFAQNSTQGSSYILLVEIGS